jgi:hypothetical protein
MLPVREGRVRVLRRQRTRPAGLPRRLSPWLAVGLLLLQTALTAGHFHPEDLSILAGRAPTVASGAFGQGSAPLPADQPALPAHDDCALCFNLQLAGGSTLPEPLLLTIPHQHGQVVRPRLVAFRLAPSPYLLFRTRAPPIA